VEVGHKEANDDFDDGACTRQLDPLPRLARQRQAGDLGLRGDVISKQCWPLVFRNDPTTALDGTVSNLMWVRRSPWPTSIALTNGTCPAPQAKTYVWYAHRPPSQPSSASLSLVSEANSHGEDAG